MNKLKHILTLLALAVCSTSLAAAPQGRPESDSTATRFSLMGYGLYDLHLATGSIGGGALTLSYRPSDAYHLDFGVEAVSSQRYALNLAGSARLWSGDRSSLSLQNRYLYRQYAQLNLQEFTGALQLEWSAPHCILSLGLCNRYQAELVQRNNGGQGTIFEPMNVMFAAEGWLRPLAAQNATWNVGFRWSNHNDFVIERVANWMYSLKGYYLLPKHTYFIAEVGIHPVGSLNLTSSYDGWYLHLGAQRNLGERSKK